MKSKIEIEKTLEKNRDKDFVLPMRWDVMFEQMLISKEAMPLLEIIISIFDNVPLKDVKGKVKILPNELRQNFATDTRSKSDIIAECFKDENNADKYIVEMNSSPTMPWRNVFYAYKVAGSGIIISNNKYVKAYQTILINFNSFNDSKSELVKMVTMRYDNGKIYDDSVKIFEVNMAKALDLSYNYVNEQEKQIAVVSRMFMTESSLELDKESNTIMPKKEAEKLVSRAKELSNVNKYIRLFDEEENYKELAYNTDIDNARKEAISEGIKQGIKQGAKETAINNAKNAKALGLDNNSISKITGLSIEEIESLTKEN